MLAAEIPDLRVSEAVDATAAFETDAARSRRHLVLLDLTLPGDNGLSCCGGCAASSRRCR